MTDALHAPTGPLLWWSRPAPRRKCVRSPLPPRSLVQFPHVLTLSPPTSRSVGVCQRVRHNPRLPDPASAQLFVAAQEPLGPFARSSRRSADARRSPAETPSPPPPSARTVPSGCRTPCASPNRPPLSFPVARLADLDLLASPPSRARFLSAASSRPGRRSARLTRSRACSPTGASRFPLPLEPPLEVDLALTDLFSLAHSVAFFLFGWFMCVPLSLSE